MDILFDLIIYLIKQAAKSSERRIVPPTPQEAQRQQAMLAQQIEAMRKTVAAQEARTQPAIQRAGRQTRPVSAGRPPALPVRTAVVPAAPRVAPLSESQISETAGPRRPSRSTRIPGMRLPFLLGEVLSAPVGLRDSDY
jgi:hypothetical protein